MASSPIIQLTRFTDTTKYKKNDITLYYNENNQVLLPPQIFDIVENEGANINKLRTLVTNDLEPKYALTPAGDEWATKYWTLYAFIDVKQRYAQQRPIQKHNPSPENKLNFVNLVHDLFGTEENSSFLGQLGKDMLDEIKTRCKDDKKLAGFEKDPETEDDVFDIIKSLKGQPDDLVFNLIYNWISSLTIESGFDWVEKSITTFIGTKHLPIALPPSSSFPKSIKRHSLARIGNKKGTTNIKSRIKKLQEDHFKKVLVLNEVVHEHAKVGSVKHNQYQARLKDPGYEIVEFKHNARYVPTSRSKFPLYYLKVKVSVVSADIVRLRLRQAITAADDPTLPGMISLLTTVFNEINVGNVGGSSGNVANSTGGDASEEAAAAAQPPPPPPPINASTAAVQAVGLPPPLPPPPPIAAIPAPAPIDQPPVAAAPAPGDAPLEAQDNSMASLLVSFIYVLYVYTWFNNNES